MIGDVLQGVGDEPSNQRERSQIGDDRTENYRWPNKTFNLHTRVRTNYRLAKRIILFLESQQYYVHVTESTTCTELIVFCTHYTVHIDRCERMFCMSFTIRITRELNFTLYMRIVFFLIFLTAVYGYAEYVKKKDLDWPRRSMDLVYAFV